VTRAATACCASATRSDDAAVTLQHHWRAQQNCWRYCQTHELEQHVAFSGYQQVGKGQRKGFRRLQKALREGDGRSSGRGLVALWTHNAPRRRVAFPGARISVPAVAILAFRWASSPRLQTRAHSWSRSLIALMAKKTRGCQLFDISFSSSGEHINASR
jgi:hypothetical protein